ncbi:GntR family transcriptional regulator [Salinicola sp. JS01]|uniref:GntR family transcriptional regulator n=1 Tax=Salinicola sp. JS01 TaxID=3050071 RepID=UPI00255B65DD|nr:GntR family transcriptional regulator [Salinicola sp. JS01]WIX33944.1 GntR family transcriptional regulator [Salinicola sp. JS01]
MAMTKKPSLNAQAFDTLRRDIISCTLKPGATITEAWISAHYAMGKAAIRHALARLTQQGLTVNQGRLGYTVAPITIRSIRDSYQIRKLVEPELCRIAAGKLDTEALETLHRCSRASYDRSNTAEMVAFSQANHEFHCTIARAAGNARLARLIEELSDDHMRIAYVSMVYGQPGRHWSRDHTDITAALEANQATTAAELMKAHLVSGEEAIMQAVLDRPEIVEAQLNSG